MSKQQKASRPTGVPESIARLAIELAVVALKGHGDTPTPHDVAGLLARLPTTVEFR
jgi:hypothetical protein